MHAFLHAGSIRVRDLDVERVGVSRGDGDCGGGVVEEGEGVGGAPLGVVVVLAGARGGVGKGDWGDVVEGEGERVGGEGAGGGGGGGGGWCCWGRRVAGWGWNGSVDGGSWWVVCWGSCNGQVALV